MPCRPPLIQSFHRSSRRLLRHPLMQEIGIQFLRAAIRRFVRRFALERLAPPLAQLDVMQHLVNRAQRMVDSGRRPWSVHKFFSCFIRRTLVLMTSGLLCGQHRPEEEDTFCTICQSGDDDGSWWWWAYKCEHHFHEGCMFAHLAFDTRCPLCRAAIWWAWRHGRNPGHGPRAKSCELAGQGRSWTHVHGSACSLRDGSRGSRQPRARSERRGRIIGPPDGPHVRVAARRAERDAVVTPITQGPLAQGRNQQWFRTACTHALAALQRSTCQRDETEGPAKGAIHFTRWWHTDESLRTL